MSDDNVLDQGEIERLLSGGGPSAPEPVAAAPEQPFGQVEDNAPMSQAELESLFGSLGGETPAPTPPVSPPSPRTPVADETPLFGAPVGGDAPLDQGDIESLLNGTAPFAAAPPVSTPSVAAAPPPPPLQGTPPKASHLGRLPVSATVSADEEGVPQGDIDYLLRRAEEALDSISANQIDLPNEVVEFQFPEFGGTIPNVEHATLDQISEVELDVKIELGRANMYLEDVLKLRKGSVVPLDKMAGDAVDIFVNGRLIARGEVLVMNENFCVRVAELLAGAIPME